MVLFDDKSNNMKLVPYSFWEITNFGNPHGIEEMKQTLRTEKQTWALTMETQTKALTQKKRMIPERGPQTGIYFEMF